MVFYPKYVLMVSCLIGVIIGFFSFDSISSSFGRMIIGALFGSGIGLMSFNDKTDPIISKFFGGGVAMIYIVGFILFYLFSSTATVSVLLLGFIVALLLYFSVSKV
jgi:hypothetical protein